VQALDGEPVALRPVWRRDARVADIAKAFEEVSREFPPLVEGGVRGRPSLKFLLEPWLGVADVRGSQRFSFPAQWLKPPRRPWGDECREDFVWPRGEEGTRPSLLLQGLCLPRDCRITGTSTGFCGNMDYRCRALPRRRGQLWQPLQGDARSASHSRKRVYAYLCLFFRKWPRKPCIGEGRVGSCDAAW